VEVRLAPDGTIVSRTADASSGSPTWDETVLRAIDKTEVLPRDIDGRVPPSMSIDFRPRE
jgi:colicin import membrane protein